MTRIANHVRGEASIAVKNAALMLRPSFAALVAAEEELGPLFAMVERAAAGQLKLSEMVALFWHCRFDAPADLTREEFSESVATTGLAAATPALKTLLGQILGGQ
jgi:Phage tail tube protein, GTA-gp10